MTYLEFFKYVEIDDKDPLRKIIDLRPFGQRQDEALDFYLHEIIERRMKSGGFLTDKRIVIRWDQRANLKDSVVNLLDNLRNRGIPIDLDPAAKSASA